VLDEKELSKWYFYRKQTDLNNSNTFFGCIYLKKAT
jgi:hypothetical protein